MFARLWFRLASRIVNNELIASCLDRVTMQMERVFGGGAIAPLISSPRIVSDNTVYFSSVYNPITDGERSRSQQPCFFPFSQLSLRQHQLYPSTLPLALSPMGLRPRCTPSAATAVGSRSYRTPLALPIQVNYIDVVDDNGNTAYPIDPQNNFTLILHSVNNGEVVSCLPMSHIV